MQSFTRVLIGLSVLGFVLAVIVSLMGLRPLGIGPEGFSRACSNLALIAIALELAWKTKGTSSQT